MKRYQEFIRRLFSLRNISPILIIILAIIGSLGLTPFGAKLSNDQVILALLAFLAIDALVERIDLLTNIEQDIQSIKKSFKPKMGADMFLKKRRSFPRMELLINEAKNELWVAGVTLDTMVTTASDFKYKMEQGCNLRFLALSPEGEALQLAAKYFSTNPDTLIIRIRNNLRTLASRLKSPEKGSIEIRILDRVFPTGYFIADPYSPKGRMIVQMYFYHVYVEEAPLFELSKEEETEWFSIFLRQFENAWNDATRYEFVETLKQ